MLQLYENVRKITELLNLTFYNIFSNSCFTVKKIQKKSTLYCSLFKENPLLLPQFFSFQLQFFLRFENHLWIKQNKLYVRRFILFFTYFSAFFYFFLIFIFLADIYPANADIFLTQIYLVQLAHGNGCTPTSIHRYFYKFPF